MKTWIMDWYFSNDFEQRNLHSWMTYPSMIWVRTWLWGFIIAFGGFFSLVSSWFCPAAELWTPAVGKPCETAGDDDLNGVELPWPFMLDTILGGVNELAAPVEIPLVSGVVAGDGADKVGGVGSGSTTSIGSGFDSEDTWPRKIKSNTNTSRH